MENITSKISLGVFLLFLFCRTSAFGQGVVSMVEYNVLYKAYNNEIVFGAGKKTKSFVLEGEGITVNKVTDSTYILRVSTTQRMCRLYAKNKRGKIMKTWVFRIMLLPDAVIYWGIYPPGSQITLDQPALRSDYGNDIFWTNSEIEIQTYEINSPLFAEPLKVSGGSITTEVIEALKRAKALNNGETIAIEMVAQVKGKDQILRKASAEFTF